MTTILFGLTLLLGISNSITTISDIWTDDFLFDTNGTNGWNNDIITVGTTNYHGWYHQNPNTNTIPSLFRTFQCTNPSHIKISFTIYYQCNIQPNDTIKLHLNNKEELSVEYNNSQQNNKPHKIHNYNRNELQTCPFKSLFNAKNINYTLNNNIINAFEPFSIDFIFSLSNSNTFIGISNIIIECEHINNIFEPSMEPTIQPTGTLLEAIPPTSQPTDIQLLSTQSILLYKKDRNNNNNYSNNSLETLISWWKKSDNMGWKVFIIVSILCSMIGCIVITCIIGYFTGKRKPKRKLKYIRTNKKEKEYKDNQINENEIKHINIKCENYNNKKVNINNNNVNNNNYEYKQLNKNKLIQTQLEIENENENKLNEYEADSIQSMDNRELSYSGNINISPININNNIQTIPINNNSNNNNETEIKTNELNSFYTLPKINNRLAPKSYESNISSNNSCDSISSQSNESDSDSCTFPTQTVTERTYLKSDGKENDEKKFVIDTIGASVTTNMTNITNNTNISAVSADTYSESDISKTATQSDYREHFINTNINKNKNRIIYFNNYNDQMELVEKDEYIQTETEISGELDQKYHNQW